ncbi:hypothetical protein [Burkholderia gladioli]|uniref:Membrane protein n=1 Tax=Burkholderia gladioli TaxID=28095 RepID=A0A095FTN2_BURGA|nr:hypothetical protein [Burkholderia gladioli]ATF90465.1 hypothetical protein CO712_35850 [Burkholderia gladioli pv. gladioli]AYQ86005.1 hypothetical protein EDD84_00305 [Burkholderia gladioli]KGC20360.1 putative membrane protein [Burkholderia gladioli]MCH7273557.1 hypothetical protein [Burkholderia gladioli]MDN7499535.1 hypothetical protein [Burkholderia gladioli]
MQRITHRITRSSHAGRDRAPGVLWIAGRLAVILAVLAPAAGCLHVALPAPLGRDHAFLGLMLLTAYALMLRAAGFPRWFD